MVSINSFHLDRLYRIYDFLVKNELHPLLEADFIIAWFIYCNHLRDYLIEAGINRNLIEDLFKRSKSLQICQSVANTEKHYNARRRFNLPIFRMEHKDLKLSSLVLYEYDPFSTRRNQDQAVFSIQGQNFSCYELMRRCLDDWKIFLSSSELKRTGNVSQTSLG